MEVLRVREERAGEEERRERRRDDSECPEGGVVGEEEEGDSDGTDEADGSWVRQIERFLIDVIDTLFLSLSSSDAE